MTPPRPSATPYQFRYARLIQIRWALSGPTVLANLGLATSYVLRGVSSASTQPVVAALDSYMVWPAAFGLVALALIVALVGKRRLEHAHALACAVLFGYATALLWGTATTAAGWATASLATAAALTSLTAAGIYKKGR